MNDRQMEVLKKHFAPNATCSIIDGIVYVDGGFNAVGDPETWIIERDGNVYHEQGNSIEGYERELEIKY